MRSKSITPMGALHPILFFAGVYVVVLLFSIFICSALFYTFNPSPSDIGDETVMTVEPNTSTTGSVNAVVLR